MSEAVESNEDISDKTAIEESIARFKEWFAAAGATASPAAVVEELKTLQTVASLRTADRYVILLGGLFTEQSVAANHVRVHAPVLKLMVTSTIHQRQLIAAAEWFCGACFPSLIKYFPVLLKQFFDEDLVDEDTFQAWDMDSTPNDFSVHPALLPLDIQHTLKTNAKKFITWLDEAEEEGEDDEEEDDDDEA